ncbi:Ribosomal RNA small subunit methyltransferase A [Pseudovibrio sp. Ad46]|uniref:class I SAM-dependent methyltransferase n=1 Tax=unclassified Pseudovibrio TaxID=2627060 RepID=UPI0007AE5DC3|nr:MULTISPECIES: methyltransferase domain-containing protein [unclassified Pseudovibrio]KZK91389.1 Ribosomal RNA small subunit methyltransferase A [Pseudovibrio sp. Ad46]
MSQTFKQKSDCVLFSENWLEAPLRTGAVLPSSSELARAMVFASAIKPGARVLEIGPGTGCVTRALLHAGVEEKDLTLIELSKSFTEGLSRDFPAAILLQQDAYQTLKNLSHGKKQFDAVVSSLPQFVYPKEKREQFRDHCLEVLKPGGRLVQFTYSTISPIPKRKGVQAIRSRRVWKNIPPAVVWAYQPTYAAP